MRDRWLFYRARGLDVAGQIFRGTLTPELAQALQDLNAVLAVNEVMEGLPVRITLEVPPHLEPSLREALLWHPKS